MLGPRLRIVPLPLVYLLATAACVSDDNTGPQVDGGPQPDVTQPTIDASLPDTSVAEASSPETSSPDSSVPDATTGDTGAIDAPADTTPPPLTLAVVNALGPEAGVTVVFQDASGAVVTTATTDTTGSVTQAVVAGSQVTAVLGSALAPVLYTITGVAPGDALTVLDPAYAGSSVSINGVPASRPDAGADASPSYVVSAGPCQTSFLTPPASLGLMAGCVSGGQFPLLVLAEDPTFRVIGFASQTGNSALADGGAAQVVVGGAWSTAMTTQTVSVTSAPASQTLNFAFTEIVGGVGSSTLVTNTSGAPDGGAQSAFSEHTGYSPFVQSEANTVNAQSFAAIATRAASAAADGTTTFDLSTLLPYVTALTLDNTTSPGRPSATWTTAASLSAADGVIVQAPWTLATDAGTVSGVWTIVAPSTATSVKAPALPSALAGYAPPGAATLATPLMMALQGSFFGGYAGLRAAAASFPIPPGGWLNTNASIVPPLPANGTLKLVTFGPTPS